MAILPRSDIPLFVNERQPLNRSRVLRPLSTNDLIGVPFSSLRGASFFDFLIAVGLLAERTVSVLHVTRLRVSYYVMWR